MPTSEIITICLASIAVLLNIINVCYWINHLKKSYEEKPSPTQEATISKQKSEANE